MTTKYKKKKKKTIKDSDNSKRYDYWELLTKMSKTNRIPSNGALKYATKVEHRNFFNDNHKTIQTSYKLKWNQKQDNIINEIQEWVNILKCSSLSDFKFIGLKAIRMKSSRIKLEASERVLVSVINENKKKYRVF